MAAADDEHVAIQLFGHGADGRRFAQPVARAGIAPNAAIGLRLRLRVFDGEVRAKAAGTAGAARAALLFFGRLGVHGSLRNTIGYAVLQRVRAQRRAGNRVHIDGLAFLDAHEHRVQLILEIREEIARRGFHHFVADLLDLRIGEGRGHLHGGKAGSLLAGVRARVINRAALFGQRRNAAPQHADAHRAQRRAFQKRST